MTWKPIETAPFQTVIEVRNPRMKRPCLATRGYAFPDGMVHEDTSYCTSVYTPNADGGLPFPAGKLVCPTEYRLIEGDA